MSDSETCVTHILTGLSIQKESVFSKEATCGSDGTGVDQSSKCSPDSCGTICVEHLAVCVGEG